METFIGFDSAWAGNAKAPGAICAVTFSDGAPTRWHPPVLVGFDEALDFIANVTSSSRYTLVALDQPTVVPNLTSNRPVERAVAALVSWLGGAVQPSNRGRIGMFCDASPVWPFLTALSAVQDPQEARIAKEGRFLIEVFPAAALPSIAVESFGRLKGMKYNPERKTFKVADWVSVTAACAAEADTLGCNELAAWCRDAGQITKPRKGNQDRLDAVICALIALRWRWRPRLESLMLGDINTGYMVMPASSDVRARLTAAGKKYGVSVDGSVPS